MNSILADTFLRCARTAVLAMTVLGAGLSARPALAQPDVRQFDIADYRAYLTDEHPVRQGMRKFAELVRAKSEGKLQGNVRTDALPGSPAKQIEALRKGGEGVPALMLVAATGLAKVKPAFGMFDLPFVVRDEREADFLLDGAFGKVVLEQLVSTGFVGLAWWENGFRQMTTSGPAIVHADDLRGLKIRVIPEPAFVDTFRAMGANPVPVPFDRLYDTLKTKRVDAQDNFYAQIFAGRLYEVQSSLSVTNHSYSPLVLVANAEFWQGLTPSERAVIQSAAIEAGRFQRQANRQEDEAARERLVAAGMKIYPLDTSELKKIEALTKSVREQHFEKIDDGVMKLYQTEIVKYRSMR